jgi:hypothetical protein
MHTVISFDEERPSSSHFIERIWRSHSEQPGSFISIAHARWEFVVAKRHGRLTAYIRGPETRATTAECPPESEWIGIIFRPGTLMRNMPPGSLVDGSIVLADASSKSFWLQASAWEYPDFENVETFVERLVRQDLLVHEPAIPGALEDRPPRGLSARSLQRYFRQVTGLTETALRQIERARYAVLLLQQGTPILDTVHMAGYFDQPHLTRSLSHYIRQTPAQILRDERRQQLSFLYKTIPFGSSTIETENA